MGEFATVNGESVKIGTCEEMYYLRADQRDQVRGYEFDGSERFRFPFPDEDTIQVGHFDDHNRGVRIPGWSLPDDFAGHGKIQFSSNPTGYLVSLPCPEGPEQTEGVTVHKNGWNLGPRVVQQKVVDGDLVTVVDCGACGGKWRLPMEEAANVAEAFGNEAEREEYRHDLGRFGPANTPREREFLTAMAWRISRGYAVAV